ncbi:MAG: hypothetical protein Q7T79_02065 [bacterium]|nr:hypothetical protein [bacterium]
MTLKEASRVGWKTYVVKFIKGRKILITYNPTLHSSDGRFYVHKVPKDQILCTKTRIGLLKKGETLSSFFDRYSKEENGKEVKSLEELLVT